MCWVPSVLARHVEMVPAQEGRERSGEESGAGPYSAQRAGKGGFSGFGEVGEGWGGGRERSSQVGPQSHLCCIHPPPNSGPLWTSCVIFSSSVSLLYFLKGSLPQFHVT